MDKNEEILKRLADSQERLAVVMETLQQNEALHTKAPATTMTATQLHGTAGIFQGPGLERDVISAHVRPFGIDGLLPMLPSTTQDPRFASITGISAPIGDQPVRACLDAPTSYLKGCNLTARFGLLRYDTETIEFDKVMLRVNRGDFTDLVLRGRLLGLTGLSPRNLNESDVLNIITASEMVQVGVQFERSLNTQIWQGVTTATNQFPGLDVQINTGQMDADTQTLCPSLDSDIKSFAYADVCATTRDIVEYMSAMEFYITSLAAQTGVDPVKWVWAMRPQLWFELSACWPCKYLTNRCMTTNVGANVAVINDTTNVDLRDEMRNSKKITVNGTQYDVVTDVGIFEHNSTNNANLIPGQYASSIYFVPLTIQGNFPVLYREHVDYRDSFATQNTSLLRNLNQFWTDDGIYSWAYEEDKWCYKLAAKTEQRVVLRTPWLAGKVQYIRYSPLQHLREADPSSSYWLDGGVSLRSHTMGHAVWAR